MYNKLFTILKKMNIQHFNIIGVGINTIIIITNNNMHADVFIARRSSSLSSQTNRQTGLEL